MTETRDPEYPGLSKEDWKGLDDLPADKAAANLAAEMSALEARHARENPAAREPKPITEGFSLAWDTPDGIVGLWSCWLRDRFYLGYPTSWGPLSEQDLADVGITQGVVSWKPYTNDDRRETNVGRYGTPLLHREAQVPVIVDQHESNMHSFHVLRGDDIRQYGPPQVGYGWGMTDRRQEFDWQLTSDPGRRVATWPFYRDASEPRDAALSRIQQTKGSFIALGNALANAHGCTAVTVETGTFVGIVPETLPTMGYETKWLKGSPGAREGWGNDAIYGKREEDEIMLVSANSLVPWQAYRCVPTHGEPVTAEFIERALTL